MKIQHFSLIILAVALLASCSGNQFKVDGTITGAADTTAMVLEVSSNGMWYIVDSVKPDNDGSFAVTSQAPEFPNIYRLRIADQAIYFPIDSLDHITVKAGLKEFGTNYTLSGSEHAEQVMKIDREAMQLAGGKGSPEQIKAWKHRLAQQIVSDPGGIVAYYAINKFIDGVPVFDPLNDEDLRIVGAVANAFNNFHPNDPRTDYLVDVLLQGQKRRRMAASEPSDTMFVTETSLLDIKLQDYNGKTHQLQDVAANSQQPRTAIGYNAKDNKLIFFVCEGRNMTEGVAGLTTAQVANILKAHGCTEALNLDGGGSSCMLINGNETIKPSDGKQRAVLDGCFIK